MGKPKNKKNSLSTEASSPSTTATSTTAPATTSDPPSNKDDTTHAVTPHTVVAHDRRRSSLLDPVVVALDSSSSHSPPKAAESSEVAVVVVSPASGSPHSNNQKKKEPEEDTRLVRSHREQEHQGPSSPPSTTPTSGSRAAGSLEDPALPDPQDTTTATSSPSQTSSATAVTSKEDGSKETESKHPSTRSDEPATSDPEHHKDSTPSSESDPSSLEAADPSSPPVSLQDQKNLEESGNRMPEQEEEPDEAPMELPHDEDNANGLDAAPLDMDDGDHVDQEGDHHPPRQQQQQDDSPSIEPKDKKDDSPSPRNEPLSNAPSRETKIEDITTDSEQVSENTEREAQNLVDQDSKNGSFETVAAPEGVPEVEIVDQKDQPAVETIADPPKTLASRKRPKPDSKQGSTTASSSAPPDITKLSEEKQLQWANFQSKSTLYKRQAKELLDECMTLNQKPTASAIASSSLDWKKQEDISWNTFPDVCLDQLCARVEGQSLSLPALASQIATELNQLYDTNGFSEDLVADKMKLVATRKNHVKTPQVLVDSETLDHRVETWNKPMVDPMADERTEFLWRWEVDMMDLLPSECIPHVKQARAVFRRRTTRLNALAKVLTLLSEAEKQVVVARKKQSQDKLKKLTARIQQEEDRVASLVQAEREIQEKHERQSQEQELKERKKDEKNKLKQQMVEEKKRRKLEEKQQKQQELAEEKQRKQQEAERKKQAVLDAKQQKEEEEQKTRQVKRAKIQKQANMMKTFFVTSKKSKENESPNKLSPEALCKPESLPHNPVLSLISGGSDRDMSCSFPMRVSDKTRTLLQPTSQMIERTVFVSAVEDDDPWATDQAFAEERTMLFRSKLKFLRFDKDVRPPYYGTWSKKSALVTGRRPFGKDNQHFDYDNDSEAEWEEGDDEIGEELGDNDDMDVEKDDFIADENENEDGWLAADDEVDNDDADEETKRLRKKQRVEDRTKTSLVLIGPAPGGISLAALSTPDLEVSGQGLLEGVETHNEAIRILQGHTIVTCKDNAEEDCMMDAFPPALTDEIFGSDETNRNNSPSLDKQRALSGEDLKAFVNVVHHSTMASKEKMLDQLRSSSERLAALSRAQALKTLESVAEKTKHPFGYLWEVKRDVLESCGLVTSSTNTASVDGEAASAPAEDLSERLQKEYLRRMARLIHHSTARSKEKVADELMVAWNKSVSDTDSDDLDGEDPTPARSASKAECLRLVLQLAEKCKAPINKAGAFYYYWQVKASKQQELGLSLPLGPPPPPLPSPSKS